MASAAKRARHAPLPEPLSATAIVLTRCPDLLASVLSFVHLEERVVVLTRVCRAWNECVATNQVAWSRSDHVGGYAWRAARPLPRALRTANAARALFFARLSVSEHADLCPRRAVVAADSPDEAPFSPFLEELRVADGAALPCMIHYRLAGCISLRELRLPKYVWPEYAPLIIKAAARGGALRSLRISWNPSSGIRVTDTFAIPALVSGLEKLHLELDWLRRNNGTPTVYVIDSPVSFRFERLRELALDVSHLEGESFFRIDAPVRDLAIAQHYASLRTVASLVRVADLETLSIRTRDFAGDCDEACLPAVTTLTVSLTPHRGSLTPSAYAEMFAATIGHTLPRLRHLRIARSPDDDGWLEGVVDQLRSPTLQSVAITKWRGPGADAFAARLRSPLTCAQLPALTEVTVM